MSPQIDLNEIANNSNLSLTITSNAEENPIDARLRRIKDLILFAIAIIFTLSAFSLCLYVTFSNNFSSDNKKWAAAIASNILSAFLGFLTGKSLS